MKSEKAKDVSLLRKWFSSKWDIFHNQSVCLKHRPVLINIQQKFEIPLYIHDFVTPVSEGDTEDSNKSSIGYVRVGFPRKIFGKLFGTNYRSIQNEKDRFKQAVSTAINRVGFNFKLSDFEIVQFYLDKSFRSVYKMQRRKQHGSSPEIPDIVIVKRQSWGNCNGGRYADIEEEVCTHRKVGIHRNITSILYSISNESENYMVMEYGSGGDLFDLLQIMEKPPSEAVCLGIIEQVVQATCYIHNVGVAHRDIKLENIVLQTPYDGVSMNIPTVQMIDFGLSFIWKAENGERCESNEVVYTEGYTPPEVFREEGKYCPKAVDVFCIGNVLYQLLSNQFPLGNGSSYISEVEELLNDGLFFGRVAFKDVSGDTIDLICKCMHAEAEERPTAEDVLSEVRDIKSKLKEMKEIESAN